MKLVLQISKTLKELCSHKDVEIDNAMFLNSSVPITLSSLASIEPARENGKIYILLGADEHDVEIRDAFYKDSEFCTVIITDKDDKTYKP
jgi:hypothetical protein